MAQRKFRELSGVWAGLPVPWNESMGIDEEAAAADVRACCRAGVHGVYTGGTTGEFYAQDDDTFRRLVELVVTSATPTATPVQAGCTALSTRWVRRRIEIAAQAGVDGIQVALPFWLRLSDEEVVAFFRDVARAAGNLPLVLYDTDRAKRRVGVELFRRIREVAPTLMGCKFTGGDVEALRPLVEALPEVSFFVGEHILPDAMRIGARGSCSSLVYLNPAFMLEYYRLCAAGEWDRVAPMQSDIVRLFTEGIRPLKDRGLMDSAIDRVFGRVLGFLRCGLRCQPPYVHATETDLDALRNWMKSNAPMLLEDPQSFRGRTLSSSSR